MCVNVLDYTGCRWTRCVEDCTDSGYPPCSLNKQSSVDGYDYCYWGKKRHLCCNYVNHAVSGMIYSVAFSASIGFCLARNPTLDLPPRTFCTQPGSRRTFWTQPDNRSSALSASHYSGCCQCSAPSLLILLPEVLIEY